MNVFVTGATGVLGQPVVRMLIDVGHQVRALARSPANESRLRAAGAQAVRAGLFDASSLRAAVEGCDAILHLATRRPAPRQWRRRDAWKENDRIRTEGTRNLVDAALETGVTVFVYPGVVFVYPDAGAKWVDSETLPEPSPILESSLKAEAEVRRFADAGHRGIVLRMGGFYGPTASSTREMLRLARRGVAMIFGASGAYQPLIWVDDAAVAVIDAFSKARSGIYDVVDDEPLERRELAQALAQAAGRKRLLRPPRFLLRILAGKDAMFLARSQRVSNRKFKAETGWCPTVPGARIGLNLLAVQP